MSAINWSEFHTKQAEGYQRVARDYRLSATQLFEKDPDFAAFAVTRAAINEAWSEESLQKAQHETRVEG